MLQTFDFVEKIILFGSRARGDNAEKSDIDLAILCPKASQDQWQDVLNIIENADTLLKIDCVRLDELVDGSELKQNINKDGVVLYAKNNH
jgi:predicted nucleotidyltransferase